MSGHHPWPPPNSKFHPSKRHWPGGMPASIAGTEHREPSQLNLVHVYCPNRWCNWHVRVDEKVREYNLQGHLLTCKYNKGTCRLERYQGDPLCETCKREGACRYSGDTPGTPSETAGDEDTGRPRDSSTREFEELRTAPVSKQELLDFLSEADKQIERARKKGLEARERMTRIRLDGAFPYIGKGKTSRVFETGATRDTDDGKYDYEGFLSPLVIQRFGEYMHAHRIQSDGTLRDSDNWQKGIPYDAYMKSGWRHFFSWWMAHRGYETNELVAEALCALIFNASGYLHELLMEDVEPKQLEQTD